MTDAAPELWALSNDSRYPCDSDGLGLSFCGVFSSPQRAIDHLRHIVFGDDIVDHLHWHRSPHNDGYISGYYHDEEKEKEYYVHIIRTSVDEDWPGRNPGPHGVTLADMTDELPTMHGAPFPDDA